MQNLDLKFVYNNLSDKNKQDIINMWTEARVVPKEIAINRVEQVSVIIYNNEDVVGVSTVYPDYLSENNPYFFFRMFIEKEYRGDNSFRKKVMQLNFHELKNTFENKLKGLALELENSKLARLGENTNYMSKRGYTYFGKSNRNLQLWYVNFDEPKGIFLT